MSGQNIAKLSWQVGNGENVANPTLGKEGIPRDDKLGR